MRSIYSLFILLVLHCSLQAQCNFSDGGIGGFNSQADFNNFLTFTTAGATDYGDFLLTSAEKHEGAMSLQIDVTQSHNWAVRMFNNSCKIPLKNGYQYRIDFWIKGEVDSDLTGYLYAGASSNNVEQATVRIETTGWEKHAFVFTSNETNDGGIKFSFSDMGTYYLDDVTVVEMDCSGEEGGSAEVDGCDICAGGNTGITPDSYCDFVAIDPNDVNIEFTGTLYENVSATEAELHRFSFDFLDNGTNGFWSEGKAKTQSGIAVEFKTNSPVMKLQFSELANSEQRADQFAVFKDGELYQDGITTDAFTITNFDLDLAVWTVTLPSFDGMVFSGLELVNGFQLQPYVPAPKPQYFAIGNSITHGVGQSDAGHLTYPFLVADSLGYEVHNLGIGGSRITDVIMTNLVGQTADVITVLWGYNDVNNPTDLDAVGGAYDRYETLIDSLCSSQPQARIFGILPTPTNTVVGGNNSSNTIADLRAEELSILTARQGTCPNLFIVESHDYVTKPGGLNDDVHLNEIGAYDLAMGLIHEIADRDCIGELDGEAFIDSCGHCAGGNSGLVPILNEASCVTGLDSDDIDNVEVHPNPSTGIFRLNEVAKFEVLDMAGASVLNGDSDTIDLSGLPTGTYILLSKGKRTKLIKE